MSWLATFYDKYSKKEIEELLEKYKTEIKVIPFSYLELTTRDMARFTNISNDYTNEIYFWNTVYKIDLRDNNIKCPDKNKGWLAMQIQMFGLSPEEALTNWDKYDLLPLRKTFVPQFSTKFLERYKELNKDVLCCVSKTPINSFYVNEKLYEIMNMVTYFDGNISE